jgi:hypothetical protein
MKRFAIVLLLFLLMIPAAVAACAAGAGMTTEGILLPGAGSSPAASANPDKEIASSAVSAPPLVLTTSEPVAAPTISKIKVTPTPAVGAEFYIPRSYYDWTVVQFRYDTLHQRGGDYHFPWSLTIRNDTDRELDLTFYLVHWGFHNWVGWVSKTPFILKAGETKDLSGEDVLDETFYNNMLYLETVNIEPYIAESPS